MTWKSKCISYGLEIAVFFQPFTVRNHYAGGELGNAFPALRDK